jgi:hypothetical protein
MCFTRAFTLPGMASSPSTGRCVWDGEAWTLRTRDMALPGLWRIDVIVLVSDFERVRFTAEVSVECLDEIRPAPRLGGKPREDGSAGRCTDGQAESETHVLALLPNVSWSPFPWTSNC